MEVHPTTYAMMTLTITGFDASPTLIPSCVSSNRQNGQYMFACGYEIAQDIDGTSMNIVDISEDFWNIHEPPRYFIAIATPRG